MPSFQPIAVTGISAIFPQARSLDEFWRLILSGRDCMQEIPPTHWLIEDYFDANPKAPGKTYSRHGAFLREVPFDPVAFGVPPALLPSTDIAQVLALILAQQVLNDCSGGHLAKLNLERTSVILGVASATEMISSMSGLLSRPMWIEGMRRAGIPEAQVQAAAQKIAALFPEWTESTFPGCLGNVVAGRVANRFNLGGTNCVTDAACASSLAALHAGVNELQLGLSDRVVTGGVDALNTIFMYMCFSKTPAMSASGKCAPFSADADGTMMGEGGGMLTLRRLDEAERDGEPIYAVIRGIGASSDGRSKSVYAPRPEGQAVALQRCYELAGYSPATVGLVEAHGTGTTAGDLCETTSLKEIFSAADAGTKAWCALGSVKSQIGHTKGAAGSAGLIKVALALRHKALPPTANIATPNPALGLADSPFYLSTRARPWIQPAGRPRRGAVSSFGFGGTNFHVAVEEYLGAAAAPRVRAFGAQVFLASAADEAALETQLAAWAALTDEQVEAAARAAQEAFRPDQPVRAGFVAANRAELAERLKRLRARLAPGSAPAPANDEVWLARGPAVAAGEIAFLFPGQGSQSVGMAAELPLHFPEAMCQWEQIEALAAAGEPSLAALVYPPCVQDEAAAAAQEDELRRTEHAQPALGAVSLAYLAVLRSAGVKPAFAAGHSYGEIPALHAAGVLSLEDCLRVSRERGRLMAAVSQARPGAMLAVLHDAAAVTALLAAESPGCVVANHNSPKQVVVAGPAAEIEALEKILAARQIAARRLPVATAFHSSIVEPACAPFAQFLEQVAFAAPTLPVFHNADAQAYPAKPAAIRERLATQLARPVRFAEQVEAMHRQGAKLFLEVGAGQVLTGLVRQTLGDRAVAVALNPKDKPADVGFLGALVRLAVAGLPVDWGFLWAGHRPAAVEPKRSAATVMVGGYNLGRPYPARDGQKTPPVTASPAASAPAALAAPAVPAAPAAAPAPKPPLSPSSVRMSAPSSSASVNPVSSPARDAAAASAVARAHETFLRTMSEAHRAFLETVAQGGGNVALPAVPAASSVSAVRPVAPPPRAAVVPAPPIPVAAKPVVVAPAPVAATPPPAPAAPAFDVARLGELVLATVAEKTGYPREMLTPEMQLEADLGIDSIKRVEILSAVQEKVPGLPAVDAKVMGGLQTLRAVSDYLAERLGAAAVPASAAAVPASGPAPTTPTAASAAPRDPAAVLEVVLATVAEKTGYPREMLTPEMQLEADLGIDSIKRVEILSSVQEKLPGLPAVDAKIMGGLQTLRAVTDYLAQQLGTTALATPTAPSSVSQPNPAAVLEVVLATVAEKTGYPREMLTPEMQLEADLGIDSIKRVEILSSVQEKLPGLPAVDAKIMGGLQTLRAVTDYLAEQLGVSGGPVSSVASAADAAPTVSAGTSVQAYHLRALEAAAPGLFTPGLLSARHLVITRDERGVATALKQALGDAGINAELVDKIPREADAVILLDGLAAAPTPAAAGDLQKRVFTRVQAAAETVSRGGLLVIVQDTGGTYGLGAAPVAQPWQGGLAGLAKTAAKEWPLATVRSIDLAVGGGEAAAAGRRLAEELLQGGDTLEAGLAADGRRTVPSLVLAPVDAGAAPRVRADSVVVATGGARGVTATTLLALARAHRPRIALLGRTALAEEASDLRAATTEAALQQALLARARQAGRSPSPKELAAAVRDVIAQREIRENLAALRAAGATAEYFGTDATDAAGLARTLEEVRRRLGPITVLVHGAGVLADKLIAEKTPEQFARVFDTKVRALDLLLAATAADPLEAIVLFSSVAGRFGNRGQSDYAMANEVLNKVAQAEASRRGSRCLVRSIGWGPWDGGMVTPALRTHFLAQGIGLIPPAHGAAAFVRELAGPATREAVEVVIGAGRLDLSASGDRPAHRAAILVSGDRYPLLRDHVVKGRAVVPLALVAEWLLAGAALGRPEAKGWTLREIQVAKPVLLDATAREPRRLELQVHLTAGPDALTLRVIDPADGKIHYTAVAAPAAVAPAPLAALADAQPFGFDRDSVYGEKLFHGPALQAVRALGGASASGAEFTLENLPLTGPAPWRVGPALADGAAQAAVLWAQQTQGFSTLPLRMGELVVQRPAQSGESIQCRVHGRRKAGGAVTADVDCLDTQGRLVASLRGLELFQVDSYWDAVAT